MQQHSKSEAIGLVSLLAYVKDDKYYATRQNRIEKALEKFRKVVYNH